MRKLRKTFEISAPRVGGQRGFTLIELMVVVGIIGVLVSLAAPNFIKYQRKARQSEAKITLAAMYVAEKSFYAEYSAYHWAMEAIGYSPEGQRRFYWTSTSTDSSPAITVTGYVGAAVTPGYDQLNSPFAKTHVFTGTCTFPVSSNWTNDPQSFTIAAQGNVGAPADDVWLMSHLKVLRNCSIGL